MHFDPRIEQLLQRVAVLEAAVTELKRKLREDRDSQAQRERAGQGKWGF